jgi:putative ABC transport system ATP-binding protein
VTAVVLEARDVTVRYGDLVALDRANLVVRAGDCLAVTGPSGSGKSTLLHSLVGVIRPDQGEVVLDGQVLSGIGEEALTALRRRRVGFVFQNGQLLPELTAAENVALPLLLDGVGRRAAEEAARALFGPLGLEGLDARRPGQLSGGQAQRVAIARALVSTPAIVLADEPTGALDRRTGQEVLDLLQRACRAVDAALVVVTHDPGVAARCDRRVDVLDGHLTEAVPSRG